ncbi:MAG: CPBP family intramembrane glutamic endopeptidase [Microbacteriaceae bacterium]
MIRTRWEIVVVLLLSYGLSSLYAIVGIVDRLNRPESLGSQTATINRPLATLELIDLSYQLLGVMAGLAPVALVVWLLWRDTAPRLGALGLGCEPGKRNLGHELTMGVVFAAAIGIPGIGVYLGARFLNLGVTVVPTALDSHWWTIPILILWALRAGIGEEVIVVGYLFNRLKQIGWSPWVIVVSAAVLRGTYHLYQGFGGFAGNIAMGLVFGALYLWKGRLLPLIVAHVIIDVTAFVGYPLALEWFPGVFG